MTTAKTKDRKQKTTLLEGGRGAAPWNKEPRSREVAKRKGGRHQRGKGGTKIRFEKNREKTSGNG